MYCVPITISKHVSCNSPFLAMILCFDTVIVRSILRAYLAIINKFSFVIATSQLQLVTKGQLKPSPSVYLCLDSYKWTVFDIEYYRLSMCTIIEMTHKYLNAQNYKSITCSCIQHALTSHISYPVHGLFITGRNSWIRRCVMMVRTSLWTMELLEEEREQRGRCTLHCQAGYLWQQS